jgi:cell wall-associated NlpC family hydrolase
MPATYKHTGTSVPAGGLAFFSIPGSSYGHVMISIGSGKFVSNDIVSAGKLSETTIATIESKWGGHYLGWSNPWF